MFFGLGFSLLLSVFCGAYEGTLGVNPYGKGSVLDPYYIRNAVPPEQEFTFEKLIQVIDQKKLTTIESVLAELPSHMMDKNYVLMYRSRSLQEATPESPRAIVYTPTASFILTFNGGLKTQRGHDTLELIQFRQETQRFEFRELSFDGINQPKVSEANPQKCLTCHQSVTRKNIDPRPNWEPYNIWIGAFGSHNSDSNRKPIKEDLAAKVLPQDREALEEQVHEAQYLQKYLNQIAPQHPRFSLLKQFNSHAPTDLTQQLQVWNLLRVQRLVVEETAIYELYKEIYSLAMKCGLTKKMIEDSPALQWHVASKPKKYYDYYPIQTLESVSSALTLLFEPLGVDTSDWSMDFGNGGRFAFYERFGTPANTQKIARWAWLKSFPGAAEINEKTCEDLTSVSLAKIDQAFQQNKQQLMQIQNRVPKPSGRDILNRCMSCHVDRLDPLAPKLPMDQPKVMATFLTQPFSFRGTLFDDIAYRTSDMATHKEQMPPNRRLSSEERSALLEELNNITHQ